jgi:hypothetical protein
MKKLLFITTMILVGCSVTANPIPPNLTGVDRSIYATNECRNTVKTNSALQRGSSNFDAYYKDGQFKYFGSNSELFQFEKCLSDLGISTKD